MFRGTLFFVTVIGFCLNMSAVAVDRCLRGVQCSTKLRFDCEVRPIENLERCDRWRHVSRKYREHIGKFKTSVVQSNPGQDNMRNITTSWRVYQDPGRRYSLVCIIGATIPGSKQLQRTCHVVRADIKIKGHVQYSLNCLEIDRKRSVAKVWNGIRQDDVCLNKKTQSRRRRSESGKRMKCLKSEPKFQKIHQRILNVSMQLSDSKYRYCRVWLMDTDIDTYLNKTNIEPRSPFTSAVFIKMKDGQYRVLIECQKGKAYERPCRSVSSLHTLIFSEPDFTAPRQVKDTNSQENTHAQTVTEEHASLSPTLVAFVSIAATLLSVLIVLILVRIVKKQWGQSQPKTVQGIDEDCLLPLPASSGTSGGECSIPLRTFDITESHPLDEKIRLLVITDDSDRISASLCRFLDTHPNLTTISMEQNMQNARNAFHDKLDDYLRHADVTVIVLTKAFIDNCEDYEGREISRRRSNQCHVLQQLQAYLNSQNNQLKKHVTLTVKLTDVLDRTLRLENFRKNFYKLDSGMFYTITKQAPGDGAVTFHNQIHQLLDTIQTVTGRRPVHVQNFFSSPEANHFLRNVTELVERNRQT